MKKPILMRTTTGITAKIMAKMQAKHRHTSPKPAEEEEEEEKAQQTQQTLDLLECLNCK